MDQLTNWAKITNLDEADQEIAHSFCARDNANHVKVLIHMASYRANGNFAGVPRGWTAIALSYIDSLLKSICGWY
jgi:hypothetical protein